MRALLQDDNCHNSRLLRPFRHPSPLPSRAEGSWEFASWPWRAVGASPVSQTTLDLSDHAAVPPKLSQPTSQVVTYKLDNPTAVIHLFFFCSLKRDEHSWLPLSMRKNVLISWVPKYLTLNLAFLSFSFAVSAPPTSKTVKPCLRSPLSFLFSLPSALQRSSPCLRNSMTLLSQLYCFSLRQLCLDPRWPVPSWKLYLHASLMSQIYRIWNWIPAHPLKLLPHLRKWSSSTQCLKSQGEPISHTLLPKTLLYPSQSISCLPPFLALGQASDIPLLGYPNGLSPTVPLQWMYHTVAERTSCTQQTTYLLCCSRSSIPPMAT